MAERSDRYRTIALDFRGHGRSEATDPGHTVAGYARDVHAFLETLDVGTVVPVGWSMGALVPWDYVDQFGTDRVGALVDVDMEASRFQWDDYEHGIADLEDRWRRSRSSSRTGRASPRRRWSGCTGSADRRAEQRRLEFDELSRVPAPIGSAIIFDALTRDYREVLPEIDVPALVCAGAAEKRGSVASVGPVADLVPDAEFELFEGSGHCPTVEEPERFDRVLGRFVDGL